jgi:hypothetical protein
MTRIMAALKPHHDIGAARQPVNNFTFALITPLGANNRYIRHSITFIIWGSTPFLSLTSQQLLLAWTGRLAKIERGAVYNRSAG